SGPPTPRRATMDLRATDPPAAAPRRAVLPTIAASVAGACSGQQSALSPDGPGAQDAAVLWWAMLAGGTAVFVLVLVLLLYAVLVAPHRRRPLKDPQRLVLAGGVVLPVVTLSALLAFSVEMGASTYARLPE